MLSITTVAIKVDAVAAGVAEHAVKDDRDAVLFCFGTQPGKVFLSPQQRVDVQVIGGVVAMVGVRFKDGVKVQAGDTQLGKVVQMLGDARKVPAKIIGIGHLSIFVGQIDRKISPVGAQGAVSRDILFRGTWSCKAVGKNLVDNCRAQCWQDAFGKGRRRSAAVAVGVQVKLPGASTHWRG